jgi:uncharacterized protein
LNAGRNPADTTLSAGGPHTSILINSDVKVTMTTVTQAPGQTPTQTAAQTAAQTAVSTPNHAVTWFEIPVVSMDRAMAFYQAMSGLALKREPFGAPGDELAVFPHALVGGVGGALMLRAGAKPSGDGTLVYLKAPALAAWLARAGASGGQVVMPAFALPDGMGTIAKVQDTEGNVVGLHSEA